MQKNNSFCSFGLMIISLLLLTLTGCGKISSANTSVGVLSAAPAQQAQQGIRDLAAEQNSGYGQAEDAKDNRLKINYVLENDPQAELQVLVRNLVQDSKKPVVAIAGATSNDATMQVAGLVNFFNVPMIVPTADGNTLFPSNNLWAFRLSAPASAYAGYFFTELLNTSGSTGSSFASLKIAILYEQNTFGESAAVAATSAAMAQGIPITEYKNFPAENPSAAQLTALAETVKNQRSRLVYVIASNPDTARALVKNLRTSYAADDSIAPIIIGQSGAFTSEAFLGSPDAEGVYILRQYWNKDRCPTNLTSFYEAQSYGAVYLLNYAVGLTNETLSGDKNWFSRTNPSTELAKFRETLRDRLKETNLNVPCLGKVAFDNTGQNKLLEFELLTIKNGSASVVNTADFIQVVIKKLDEINSSFD